MISSRMKGTINGPGIRSEVRCFAQGGTVGCDRAATTAARLPSCQLLGMSMLTSVDVGRYGWNISGGAGLLWRHVNFGEAA